MSHELRTPLNAVLGFAQMLEIDKRHPLSEDQKESLKAIHSAGSHLLDLINDILDLTRIEANQVYLDIQEVEANAVVADCIRQMKALGSTRQVVFLDHFTAGPSIMLRSDPLRFKQCLLNLLSNAAKYNKDGGSVTVEGRVMANGWLRLSVIDTGQGISEEEKPNVFRLFHRAGADPLIAREGTGIGLAVTKNLIEQMGGRVGFYSEVGFGSTFYLDLPLASNPSALIWTEDLRVGIDAIDSDHQELFLLTNQISSSDLDEAELDRALVELVNHVRFHFQREEAILELCGHADQARHVQAHGDFLAELAGAVEAWRRHKDRKAVRDLTQRLRAWWEDHIAGEINEFAPLARAGRSQDIRRALAQPTRGDVSHQDTGLPRS